MLPITPNLYIVRYYTHINANEYWKEVIFKNLMIILFSFPIPTFIHLYWDGKGVVKSITVISVSLLITAFTMYFFGIDKNLKNKIKNYITYKIPYIIVKILHK